VLSGIEGNAVKVLHIIRTHKDEVAHRTIVQIRDSEDVEQAVVLIQDGVYWQPQGLRVFACEEDAGARGITTRYPRLDYGDIIEMIFEHDKVITW
jgi:sulfur relay protein TusB/DsrH